MGEVKCGTVVEIGWWLLLFGQVVAAGIACLSNPCFHGICIDELNSSFSCYCVDGYTGVQCQTNWDECWSSPCENGGTCIDGIASFNCSCPEGFIGDNCETNYNECESNPCQNNGTCIDMTNGYVCSCVPGFIGDHCEVDIAVCNASDEIRCHNGGQCIEGPGFKFYCKCMPGWAGSKCEDPVDECESNPCMNGAVCIDVHADYMCACTFGYTGKSCETQIEFCDSSSCSSNALCVVEEGARVCYCVPDYHGERCELQYDECQLGPGCKNGGTCIDGVDNYTCSCPPRLTGELCECLIMDNGTYDCDYIRPTLRPGTTQSVLLTTLQEFWTTTDLITVTYSPSLSPTVNDSTTSFYTSSDTNTWYTSTQEISSTSFSDSSHSTTELTTESATTESVTIPSEDLITGLTTSSTTTTEEESILSTTEKEEDTTTDRGPSCSKTTKELTVETTKEYTDKEEPNTDKSTTVVVTTESITTTEFGEKWSATTETLESPLPTEGREDTTTDTKFDITTKLFTETPTEHTITEETTTQSYTTLFTTEGIDYATTSDNTTVYSTVQPECSESICNNRGTCISTPQGNRCNCNFLYGGKFCDEKISITSAAFGGKSYIVHRIRNSTSIYIKFNAKTLQTDGQIMFVDIAKNVYMQLFMNSGLIKFKFSCGYQTMLLSELKIFVNKGYSIMIDTRLDIDLKNQHCNATLRLNDTVAMSGGQIANIDSLNNYTSLYLGNAPNVKDIENIPFVGCIKDLMVNGSPRDVFGESMSAGAISECHSLSCLSGPCLNGGSCSDRDNNYTCSCANGWMGERCEISVCDHNLCQSGGSCIKYPGSGFLCLCPYGKHGMFCEYNVEITRPSLSPIAHGISSYVVHPLGPSALNSDRFDLRMRFHTNDMDQISLLAFVGQNGRHDSHSQHLAVTFVKGYIMLTWNMGSGPRRVFTPRAVTSRRGGHWLRVARRGRSAWLSVDGRYNVSGNAPGTLARMTTAPYLYIGGHWSAGLWSLPHDLPLHGGWRGCVWEVGGGGVRGAAGGRGAGECAVHHCSAAACHAPNGVCVDAPATYGCICNEGWFGPTCSSKRNPCDSVGSKCRGQCVVTGDAGGHCDCPYGTTGDNCDEVLYPTDVRLSGVRSWVRVTPRPVSSVSLALELEVKPDRARGLLLYIQTPHFYTSLSIQGGLLEYRWTERVSGVSSLVRSAVVVGAGAWQWVRAGRYGGTLYVWAHQAMHTVDMAARAYPHTATNATVLIGGAEDLSTLPFDVMSGPPESFKGCIRNLHVNNVLITLEKKNIEAGQNVADCDGTACGAEMCGCGAKEEGKGGGGGEGGCSCSKGGRCARETALVKVTNITTPQFSGSSVLSLTRKPASTGRLSEQRRGAPHSRPSFVSMNFTTAEPDGLLFWGNMDKDYLGIGLENGHLKIVWAFHKENSSYKAIGDSETKVLEAFRKLNMQFPDAGFLSDGEWHVLNVRLSRDMVVVLVDELMAYSEEPGLTGPDAYSNVDLFVGGIPKDENVTVKKFFPYNFKGCIDDIWTSEEGPALTNYTDT